MNRSLIFLPLVLVLSCGTPSEPVDFLPEHEAAVTQETFGSSGEDRDPEIDIRNGWVYYASTTYADNYDIYRKRPNSKLVSRVTFTEADERFPKIHPTLPNVMAVSSNLNGEWDIFLIKDFDRDPANWRRISESGSQDIHPSWSPDGTKLVYASSGEQEGAWHLKILDLKTGMIFTLPEVDGLLPEWSPVAGDNRIVFQRMRNRGNWFSAIWTIRFQNGTVTDMTAITGDGDWAAINPSWSPDGKRIVFATVARSRLRSRVTDDADDLWMVSADGTRRTQLTRHVEAEWMPTWGRDGKIYFLSRRGGKARVWSMAAPMEDRVMGTGNVLRRD